MIRRRDFISSSAAVVLAACDEEGPVTRLKNGVTRDEWAVPKISA